MQFSMERMRHRSSVMMRSGRAWLERRLEWAATFDPTVGSRRNFYWSFRMPFPMKCMRDRYSVMMRSGRAKRDGRFESAITFERTVGSRSNFYWGFRMPFSMEWMRDRYTVMMRSLEPGLIDGLKGHNIRSDRWIAIKLLLEFSDALFHGVDEGSLLSDDEVRSSQA